MKLQAYIFLFIYPIYGFVNKLQLYRSPISKCHPNEAHKWYVIGDTDEYNGYLPKKVVVNGSPITIWKDNNDRFMGIHDICPHRGASLSKGRIDNNINCVVNLRLRMANIFEIRINRFSPYELNKK